MGIFNKRVILILLASFSAFILFYSLILFPQQKSKESRRKARVAKLNYEIESAQKALEAEKARVMELLSKRIDFNFHIAGERSFKMQIPFLLDRIQRLSDSCGIMIKRIEPLKEEEFENYMKYPIAMDFISDYRGFVQFVGYIEGNLNLNLCEFSVESEKGSEGRLFIRCIINAYEIKDAGIVDLKNFQKERKKEKLLSSLEIKRDPFQRPGMERRPVAFQETHHLQGIIKWGENYQAIIDNREYKIGDRLGERTIVDILEDRVLLDGKTPPLILKRKVEK